MLGAAPLGLLLVNRGADANKLDDLLTNITNCINKRYHLLIASCQHSCTNVVK